MTNSLKRFSELLMTNSLKLFSARECLYCDWVSPCCGPWRTLACMCGSPQRALVFLSSLSAAHIPPASVFRMRTPLLLRLMAPRALGLLLSGCVQDFVLSFPNLIMVCLGKDFFAFIIVWVSSASQICAEFGDCAAIIPSDDSSCSFSGNSWRGHCIFSYCHMGLRSCSFPLFSLFLSVLFIRSKFCWAVLRFIDF